MTEGGVFRRAAPYVPGAMVEATFPTAAFQPPAVCPGAPRPRT